MSGKIVTEVPAVTSATTKFKVNHLVTFTSSSQNQQTYYEGIRRLQEVEQVIGVWRQKVLIELSDQSLNILDAQSSEVIEHFPIISVRKPEAIDYNTIYCNLLIFTVYLSKESAEMHIFDCRTQPAVTVVQKINEWRKQCLESMPRIVSTIPVVNNKQKELKSYSLIDKNKNDSQLLEGKGEKVKTRVNTRVNTRVKETVNAFNRIAIQRKINEKIEKMVETEDKEETDDNWELKPKKLQPFRYF